MGANRLFCQGPFFSNLAAAHERNHARSLAHAHTHTHTPWSCARPSTAAPRGPAHAPARRRRPGHWLSARARRAPVARQHPAEREQPVAPEPLVCGGSRHAQRESRDQGGPPAALARDALPARDGARAARPPPHGHRGTRALSEGPVGSPHPVLGRCHRCAASRRACCICRGVRAQSCACRG